jgi:hypothetical protein
MSGKPGDSAVSNPSMKLMPEVRLSTQPPRAAPLTAMPHRLTHRPERTSASAPQPIWRAAITANEKMTERSSPWVPTQVAWMAPAPSEARAAIRSGPGMPPVSGSGTGSGGGGA